MLSDAYKFSTFVNYIYIYIYGVIHLTGYFNFPLIFKISKKNFITTKLRNGFILVILKLYFLSKSDADNFSTFSNNEYLTNRQ